MINKLICIFKGHRYRMYKFYGYSPNDVMLFKYKCERCGKIHVDK